ncbi:hypothetical protein [Owenweeksia hongkongensis]|uniref:hypothetical protein n=1 Tax=Owenweeksia hongkongensis TaxID=253245 RepID=UPI003A921E70
MEKICKIVCFHLMLCLGFEALSQHNHLNKMVSINVQNTSIKQVLASIESQSYFYFSYDAELVPQDSIVSIQLSAVTVEDVLKNTLPRSLDFKSVGNHVVIFQPLNHTEKQIMISGYITDGRSGKPLTNATLYEPGQDLMVTSNANGYFEMTVSGEVDKIGLTASKSGYRQEVAYIQPKLEPKVDFKLVNNEKQLDNLDPKPLDYPDVNERAIVKLMVPQRVIENSENLTLFEKAKTQISILPGIGTRGLLNGNSTNSFSINILAGYSQGTEGLEMGSLFNINRKDMSGIQLAGLGNITGRFVNGFQAAGVFNYNGLDLDGVQAAGFSNINGGKVKGWQTAGFSNVVNGELSGVQLASFSNVATKKVEGSQIAAFSNVATKEINGMQLSAFNNYAKELNGIQISSFVNYAGHNKGVQLGFFNYADTSSGIPIGFMSIVKHGYHVLEISGTEAFPANVGFKTGVNLFYNIFETGIGNDVYHATYGIGTMPSLGGRWSLSMDLTAGAILQSTSSDWENLPVHFRFTPAINFQVSRKFAIVLGPSINYFAFPLQSEDTFYKLSSYSFYEQTKDDWYEQAWIGAKLAVRFF